jgi:hypothetical protein
MSPLRKSRETGNPDPHIVEIDLDMVTFPTAMA